ncbi:MAG: alginate lyase family protein, partial [Armatimonadota bacterium]|nr:alginate lyase family protein [Armatimonadota bacterium]
RRLLERLDLDRPELKGVKEALGRDDLPAAKGALVRHFRTRPRPVGPEVTPDGSAAGVQAADDILQHIFRLAGCPPTRLEAAIQWNEDPHRYNQWAIALNRHYHWVTLGRAYLATKDEKYAREFVAQLNSWLAAMPVYIPPNFIEGPYLETGKYPLSLDAGIRMGQTWWAAYACFKDSPSFDVETQFRLIRSFYEHARYLMDPRTYHPTSNWGAMETNGLFHLAVLLPEFRESEEWLRTAVERLGECYRAQVYPDGAQIELAPGYHGVTLDNFLGVLELARRNDVSLPAHLVDGLERMFEYYVAIATPDARTPALNDSGWGAVRGMLARGTALFPAREDFRYLGTAGRAGVPPGKTSWALPYAGWYVMRTGWGTTDHYLHFEAGPYGAAHQHEDKLSVLLCAGGKLLLTEAGVYSYDESDWRRYVLSSRAHNVVLVDGLEQNRRTRRDTHVQWEPEKRRWVSNADFDYAEGVYNSGFGPQNAVKVTHFRQVVFLKPDYWLLIDTLVPEDAATHQYEAIFHLDAPDAAIDPATRSVTAEADGHALRILPLDPGRVQVEVVKGQKDPVQGWLPTGRHNELRPIPTALYRWSAAGPSSVAYALLPRRPGEDWTVTRVRSLAGVGPGEVAAELVLAGGGRDLLIRRPPGATAARYEDVESDAEVLVRRWTADGTVKVLRVGAPGE